jgi:hypothetical protein
MATTYRHEHDADEGHTFCAGCDVVDAPEERIAVPGTVKRWTGTVEDFGDYEGEVSVTRNLDVADVVISLAQTNVTPKSPHPSPEETRAAVHYPVIDLDVPVTYVPSTTEGHGHLYIDVPMTADQQWALLAVMVSVGLVEPGYLAASMKRGYTSVRLPWVKKADPLPAIPDNLTGDPF